jgi:hypothetical protein
VRGCSGGSCTNCAEPEARPFVVGGGVPQPASAGIRVEQSMMYQLCLPPVLRVVSSSVTGHNKRRFPIPFPFSCQAPRLPLSVSFKDQQHRRRICLNCAGHPLLRARSTVHCAGPATHCRYFNARTPRARSRGRSRPLVQALASGKHSKIHTPRQLGASNPRAGTLTSDSIHPLRLPRHVYYTTPHLRLGSLEDSRLKAASQFHISLLPLRPVPLERRLDLDLALPN